MSRKSENEWKNEKGKIREREEGKKGRKGRNEGRKKGKENLLLQ